MYSCSLLIGCITPSTAELPSVAALDCIASSNRLAEHWLDRKFGFTTANSVYTAPLMSSHRASSFMTFSVYAYPVVLLAFAFSSDISLKGEFIQNRNNLWPLLMESVVTISISCLERVKIWIFYPKDAQHGVGITQITLLLQRFLTSLVP